MQKKLLIVLTVLFLIIIAPSLLFAMVAPDRLGFILVTWSLFVIVTGGVVWGVRKSSQDGSTR